MRIVQDKLALPHVSWRFRSVTREFTPEQFIPNTLLTLLSRGYSGIYSGPCRNSALFFQTLITGFFKFFSLSIWTKIPWEMARIYIPAGIAVQISFPALVSHSYVRWGSRALRALGRHGAMWAVSKKQLTSRRVWKKDLVLQKTYLFSFGVPILCVYQQYISTYTYLQRKYMFRIVIIWYRSFRLD